jgi:hypothetical protein
MDGVGSSYEKLVDSLLSPIASMIRVPREQDFGIDFYCQPRAPVGAHTETVTDLAALQVKSEDVPLRYGGLDPRGEWRKHEFTWLMSLATPLYLTEVARDRRSCEIFSLAPLWRLFIAQSVYPFEVTLTTQPASTSHDWKLTPPLHEPAANRGDGQRWTLDVGPPILRLSVDDPNDQQFQQIAVSVLRTWIAQDRLNLMRFHQSIPALTAFTGWQTNSIKGMGSQIWQYWSPEPGANLERLCQTAEPLLVNLGIHLKSQNDRAAYALVPVLEWLGKRHLLGGIGQGLLTQLIEASQRGLGPAEDLKTSESGVEVSPSPSCEEDDSGQGAS